MARITIDDLPVMEDLSETQARGIFGGQLLTNGVTGIWGTDGTAIWGSNGTAIWGSNGTAIWGSNGTAIWGTGGTT